MQESWPKTYISHAPWKYLLFGVNLNFDLSIQGYPGILTVEKCYHSFQNEIVVYLNETTSPLILCDRGHCYSAPGNGWSTFENNIRRNLFFNKTNENTICYIFRISRLFTRLCHYADVLDFREFSFAFYSPVPLFLFLVILGFFIELIVHHWLLNFSCTHFGNSN